MIKRLISSLALIGFLFTSIYFGGGLALALILLLLSILGVYELSCILHNMDIRVNKVALTVANTAIVGSGILASLYTGTLAALAVSIVVFLLGVFAFAISFFEDIYNKNLQQKGIASILSLLALSLPISLYAIVSLFTPISFALVIWVIFATKFTDIGGYIFGICLGNHKIAPSISPAKSYEGLFGGLASSFVVGIFAITAYSAFFPASFTILHAGLWAVLIGFMGLLSDLLESAFKRLAKTKDSGAIIPGIGGVLDLLDSILVNAPLAFLIAILYYI